MPRILQNENLKFTFKMCALKSIVFTYFMCVCVHLCAHVPQCEEWAGSQDPGGVHALPSPFTR